VSDLQYNSSKFQKEKVVKTNNELEQFFGNGNLFEQQQLSGGMKPIKKVQKRNVELYTFFNVMDKIPISPNKGYLMLLIIAFFLIPIFLFNLQIGNALASLIVVFISFLFWKRVSIEKHDSFSHYLNNAVITLKAMLKQLPFVEDMVSYSKQIVTWSILVAVIQVIIFELFLPAPLNSLINGLTFFIMIVGVLFCFANKELAFIHLSLKFFSLFCLVRIIYYGLFHSYLYGFLGISFLFFWTISIYVRAWDQPKNQESKSNL